MKISINILPDKQKEVIEKKRKIGLITKLSFSLIVVLIVINALLIIMQVILGIELQAVRDLGMTSATGKIGKEIQLEKAFKDANVQVSVLSKISRDIPDWAKILIIISDLIPDGVRVYKLAGSEEELKITGFCKTRNDFLEFQNRLKGEGFQVPTDISNLVSSNNFNFNLNLGIPSEYLFRK